MFISFEGTEGVGKTTLIRKIHHHFEEQGKQVEFMLYPGGRHGWGGAKGKHFTDLKNQFIYKHLLEKAMPASK